MQNIKLPKAVEVVTEAALEPLVAEFTTLFGQANGANGVMVKATKRMAEIELTIMGMHTWKGSEPSKAHPGGIPAGPDFRKQSKHTRDAINGVWETLISAQEMAAWCALHGRDVNRHPVKQSVDRYRGLLAFDFIKAAGYDPHKWDYLSAKEEEAIKAQKREERRLEAEAAKNAPTSIPAIEASAAALRSLTLAIVNERSEQALRSLNDNLASIKAAISRIESDLWRTKSSAR